MQIFKFGKLCAFALALAFSISTKAQRVIPAPVSVVEEKGVLSLNGNLVFRADDPLQKELNYLKSFLREDLGLSTSTKRSRAVEIRLSLSSLTTDTLSGAYQLRVGKRGIEITGASAVGVFYGIQTLKQLIVKDTKSISVRYGTVVDRPRFAWREFMFDEARYFKGKAVVKQLLDEMALLKMNVFHWHLSDNTGWRIEIKKYPLLTRVGSKRDSSEVKINGQRGYYDGKPHEGFYTQEDIREIIQYAADRHITVVPEIDMPGHTSAAIAAYPWLGSLPHPIKVPSSFANQPNVLKVSDPRVIAFAQDVLDEIIALFPSKVIHIGGDEVIYDQWNGSAEIQDFIRQKGLSSVADLQLWFINTMSRYIESKGRRMMGWNEILGDKVHEGTEAGEEFLSGALAENTIVDFWKGDVKLIKRAAERGYDIVNSLNYKTYMDIPRISLSSAYDFEPVPAGLDSSAERKILGLACHMWSEWIPAVRDMHLRVFPKLAAFAETGWSQKEKKSYEEFLASLAFFHEHWSRKNIAYSME